MRASQRLSALLLLACSTAGAAGAPAPGDLRVAGSVAFAISCQPALQPEFNRAVALLHSFFYEESRRIFTSVAAQDPSCAMAHWGIAQTWWHPIWAPPLPDEFAAGRAAAERALALESTPRERGFIQAIAVYYRTPDAPSTAPVGQSCHGPVGAAARVLAYENAMRTLYRDFPQDFEVRVFHAFAMLAAGYANPTDSTLAKQKAAGALLETLWKENARHPGVAHYLIHAYDYPALAQRALPAARAYGAIAPWVPHALHMPSHIFTRLGLWDDAVRSNQASADASRAYAAQRGRTAVEVEELHALDYALYSYLQQGRDEDARAIAQRVAGVQETFPAQDFVGAYALAAIPARFALEREAWQEAATAPIPPHALWARYPFTEALFEYAHALGRAHLGDADGARAALARLRSLREATTEAKFDYFRRHLDLQMLAANAWLAHAQGDERAALDGLRAAADAEDALGKHPVTPGALMPAREQLGALLLELRRPREALAAYRAALLLYPARLRGLYGAGLAAEQAGERATARRYFTLLVAQAAEADPARSELVHARAYLEPAGRRATARDHPQHAAVAAAD